MRTQSKSHDQLDAPAPTAPRVARRTLLTLLGPALAVPATVASRTKAGSEGTLLPSGNDVEVSWPGQSEWSDPGPTNELVAEIAQYGFSRVMRRRSS